MREQKDRYEIFLKVCEEVMKCLKNWELVLAQH